MGFNRYILNITIRSLLLAITALLMVIFAIKLDWISTFIFFILLFILQIFLLINYASRINRDLANFLIHLKEQNTSINFSNKSLDRIFGGISKEFEKINQEFKKVEDDKIRQQNLLNLILNKVGTGIVLIDNSDNIKIRNSAICSILGLESDCSATEFKIAFEKVLNNCGNILIGDQKIISLHIHNITRRILINLSEIRESGKSFKIFTFHDIDREITDYELQSWNGIIKVLSHELLNTLTPISTAIDTVKECVIENKEPKPKNNLNQKDINDTVKSVTLIDNRIENLHVFISKFRQFLDIPVPELQNINITKLAENVIHSFNSKGQTISVNFPEEIKVIADIELTELVLINVIKNAIEANASIIDINTEHTNNKTIIEIKDNANGIDENNLNKVFLPFFTTKQNGSGIGLSVSRQIMCAQKGDIEIKSDNNGTIVSLIFSNNINDL